MNVGRPITESPPIEELAVLVEYLYTMIVPIVDEYTVRLRIDRNSVHVVEVTGPRIVARTVGFLAPRQQIVAVLIELHDASAVVTIRNHGAAV